MVLTWPLPLMDDKKYCHYFLFIFHYLSFVINKKIFNTSLWYFINIYFIYILYIEVVLINIIELGPKIYIQIKWASIIIKFYEQFKWRTYKILCKYSGSFILKISIYVYNEIIFIKIFSE